MDREIVERGMKILFVLMMFITLGLSVVAGLMYYYSDEIPPLSELERFDLKVGSEVYDCRGRLIFTYAMEQRHLTDIDTLPKHLIQALIATEDSEFYRHWGVDLAALTRAVIIDVFRGGFKQGASTITQQLARNLFLDLDKTIPRKIKEFMLAVKIEQKYTKDEILELYMNKVSVGPGIYGVERAAQVYFGKSARDLNLTEAAVIAGNIQLPSRYYPLRYPDRAIRRRNIVLKRMMREGYLDRDTFEAAKKMPLGLRSRAKLGAVDYFTEHIRSYLEDKYGTKKLFTQGLKIYTTLDYDLQVYADSVLNEQLKIFEEANRYKKKYADFPADTIDIATPYVQGGVYVMDVETGQVRVMIGGRNFAHSKFNRMIHARRQPGSSFKPIVYTTAIENGFTPSTVIKDNKIVFIQDGQLFWEPANYEKDFGGIVRMRDALKMSRNIWAVKMITQIGPQKVVDKARQFGITTPMDPYYSIAIGSAEVKPEELISAYSAFPGQGYRSVPYYLIKVEDSEGHILEQHKPRRVQVMDEKVAYLMTSMLKTVIENGTGYDVIRRGFNLPAGGKTGTTNDYRDAWFIGFTKNLVCGVWVGFDDNRPLGGRGSGSVAALPSWPYIMKYALTKDAPLDEKGNPQIGRGAMEFRMPDGIITEAVSRRTGLLPRSGYEDTITEYFISGTQPTDFSDSLGYNTYPTKFNDFDSDLTVFVIGSGDPSNVPGVNLNKATVVHLKE